MADAGQEGGVIDLIAIKVQHRQHRAVGDRVEELVTMPASGEGAGFGLAVAHHYESDQIGVVVDCPVRMRDTIPELTALVDAARRFGSSMAADPAWERKLLEEAPHSRGVFTLVGINLRIRSLEVCLGQDSRRAVARP